MEAKQLRHRSALALAYQAVTHMGHTHSSLMQQYAGMNYPTLARIRDGRSVKECTRRYYLKCLVAVLHHEYMRCITQQDDRATAVLRMQQDILLAEVDTW